MKHTSVLRLFVPIIIFFLGLVSHANGSTCGSMQSVESIPPSGASGWLCCLVDTTYYSDGSINRWWGGYGYCGLSSCTGLDGNGPVIYYSLSSSCRNLPDGALGKPDGTSSNSSCGTATSEDPYGSPRWEVNMLSMNLYVSDIPLWYVPPIGPPVKITMSHNSRSAIEANAPFGNKWTFNYGSYLVVGTGNVTLTMPDGRKDIFTSDGNGGFVSPYGVFNKLTAVGTNYELAFVDGITTVYGIPPGSGIVNPVVLEIRDSYNQSLMFGYNSNDRLATITDATGKVTSITYFPENGSKQGLIQSVQDPFGRSAAFDYTDGNLTSVTDMGGYSTSYQYDSNGYLSSIQSGNGTWGFTTELQSSSSTYYYPAPGTDMGQAYRITVTDPLNNKQEYYFSGPYSWYVSPRDYIEYVDTITNNYHARKTTYHIERDTPTPKITKIDYPEGGYIQYTNFDAAGNAQTVTHYHGKENNLNITHSVQNTYNAHGLVTSTTDAMDKTITYVYYPNNVDLQTITNPLGTISFTYNGSTHDIASITDRLGNLTELAYNTYGQLTSVTEAKNSPVQAISEFVYDSSSHNLTEVKKTGSTIATLTYDTKGRVSSQTDATGITTTLEYNNLDKVTKVTFPDTRFIQIDRSTLHPDLIDSVTDRGGQTTGYTHDSLNRLTSISGPQGIYDYQYDNNGNMTKLIDSNRTPAVETVFEYNLDNQLIKKTYTDNKYLSYVYDKAGLLKTATNARNIATTFTYDENHNLLTTNYADSTPDVTNTYDDYNRLITRVDGTGTTTYGYDNNGRLTSVNGPYSNDNITYQYDELNRVKALLPQTGQALSYVYDTLGRLKDIQAGTSTFTYSYSGASRLIQTLTRPNGSYTEYQYNDPLKKLTAVINMKSTGDVINKFDYTYSTRDLIATETVTNGQIIDNFIANSATETPNTLNQIISRTAQGQTKTYVYDFDGNMTTGFTPEGYAITMTYDAQNRMKSAEYTDSNSILHRNEYSYAGDSLLSELKKFDASTLTGTTRYLRSGFLPMQERDAANTVAREYTWGQNLGGGIGGLLNLRQGATDYTYLYDGKGNVSALIDNTQAVVASYAYDPFGRLMSKSGTLDQPYTFSTKEYDSRTGMNYYSYRFYDSCSGKWSTRDPLGEDGGINLYGFVGNNAVNFVDPLGLWTLQVGTGGSAGAGKGVTAVSGFAISYSKEYGFEFGSFQTQGAGGYGGVSASFSLIDIAWSKNKSICDLRGSAGTIQTSVGHPLSPFSLTGEVNLMPGVKPSYGFSVNFGKGKTWLEEHGFYTHTWLQRWGAIR